MENREVFVHHFLVEAEENLSAIESGCITLRKDPGSSEELNSVLRALHTIKGSTRLLEYPVMEQVAHETESVLKGVREGSFVFEGQLLLLVFAATAFMRQLLDRIAEADSDNLPDEGIIENLKLAAAGEGFEVPASETSASIRSASGAEKIRVDSVRVAVSSIERMIELIQSLIIRQFQLKKDSAPLCRFYAENGSTGNAEVDKLLASYCKSSREHFALIERSAYGLIEQAYGLRMLPMDLILSGMPKMVEETALSLGKEVSFVITGADVSLDRMVLEQIKDPLIHLVRNAVDHGLESTQKRQEAGKRAEGEVRIDCRNEGQYILIAISDDGGGINFEKVRQRAIEMNPGQEEEIRRLDEDALSAYLFAPGFSTRKEATELSGRGVGLDIVQENLERVKGRITVHSVPEQGTRFEMRLPLSLATVSGFFARVGEVKCFIPGNYIDELLILKDEDTVKLHDGAGLRYRNRIIGSYPVSRVMESGSAFDERDRVAVIVNLFGETSALTLTGVDEYSSRILKPLPPLLNGVQPLQGVVFDDAFDLVPVLRIPEIVRRIRSMGMGEVGGQDDIILFRLRYRRILVVDDSLSTREIEKAILESGGYQVDTAKDGIEGLEKLKRNRYDMVLSDIEMPEMDGFTFIRNLRSEQGYASVPVVVVTNLEDADLQSRVNAAGADRVLVKADFDRGNLLDIVRELVGEAEVPDGA